MRRFLPLAGAFYAVLAAQPTYAEATRQQWTCTALAGVSWTMDQPVEHYEAGLMPTWADCLAWRDGDPGPGYLWSYGVTTPEPTTTTTTTEPPPTTTEPEPTTTTEAPLEPTTTTTAPEQPPTITPAPQRSAVAPGASNALAPGVTPEAQRAIVAAALGVISTTTRRKP